jgi:hypothetical protein
VSPSPQPLPPRYDDVSKVDDALDTAIEQRLSAVLDKVHIEETHGLSCTNSVQILPDALVRLFAVSSPPVSDITAVSSVGALISARIAADAKALLSKGHAEALQETRDDILDDALDVRKRGDDEFFEELNEQKCDLLVVKDDCVGAIEHEFSSKVEELNEMAAEIVEGTKAGMEEIAETICLQTRCRLEETRKVHGVCRERERVLGAALWFLRPRRESWSWQRSAVVVLQEIPPATQLVGLYTRSKGCGLSKSSISTLSRRRIVA